MKTVREWLRAKWGEKSLREMSMDLRINHQSLRQWALGHSAPSLAACRKIAAVMSSEGLVADPVAIYSEAVAFSAHLREKMRAGLDEPARIEETDPADNTPGSDTISGAR